MWMILLIVLIIIIGITMFFHLPGSKTKTEFNQVIKQMTSDITRNNDVFKESDIKDLPKPVQNYFHFCGYLGIPKMSYMKIVFKNVDFKLSQDKPNIKIDYTQYNFLEKPTRFALINSTLYGIPFEGLDSYKNGVGSMKGTIAKVITLFDQRGEFMNKACLVTFLSECLILPSVALQDYIVWEVIDDTHAKAILTYYGISVSGIFTFDQNGAMLSFRTSDRVSTGMDGSTKVADWSEICSDYKEVNGIKLPNILQAVWHYEEGDYMYFDGKEVKFEYK
jgi:hypothetical protein